MNTYSADGTMTIPFNITEKASGIQDMLTKLLYENDIGTVTITTKSGDALVLNYYDDIRVEYNEQNIHIEDENE